MVMSIPPHSHISDCIYARQRSDEGKRYIVSFFVKAGCHVSTKLIESHGRAIADPAAKIQTCMTIVVL